MSLKSFIAATVAVAIVGLANVSTAEAGLFGGCGGGSCCGQSSVFCGGECTNYDPCCGGHRHHCGGFLKRLFSHSCFKRSSCGDACDMGCCEAQPECGAPCEPACGAPCEPACGAPEPSCGCEADACCDAAPCCAPRKSCCGGLLRKLFGGCHRSCGGCDSCCEPACGAPEPSCGCN